MGYKLLAIDLDKTLLRNDRTISSRNYDALKWCQNAGILVVLTSGREVETIDRFSDTLEIYDPITSCSGAIVCGEKVAGRRDVLYHKPIPAEIVGRVMEFTRAMGWCLIVHCLGEILALEQDKYTELYVDLTGATLTFVDSFYEIIRTTEAAKLTVATESDMRENLYQQLAKRWGTEVNVTKTNPEYVEINARGVHKGNALTELCRMIDVPLSQVMAFGDNYSDLPMLRVSRGKVLMANASNPVKMELMREFDDVIIAPPNEDDGVARVIEVVLR